MLEAYGLWILVGSVVLGTIGYLWLVVRAFKQRLVWGLGLLIFPPLALFFSVRHFRRARGPILDMLVAALAFATPYGMSYYAEHFVKLGPHERRIDGEVCITVTGLKDFDYAALLWRPDTAVLQMANEDVTDRTLEYLKDMNQLHSLDVSGAQITDEGLRILAELPRLRELRLARTKSLMRDSKNIWRKSSLTQARPYRHRREGQDQARLEECQARAAGLCGLRRRGLAEIWDSLFAAVAAERKQNDRPIWITGHSLGGALAMLAAWRFKRKFVPVHQIYTFGAPMIGNNLAAEAFDREFPERIFRYVNFPDPVPLLPTVSLIANHYCHCGREMMLGAVTASEATADFFKTNGRQNHGRHFERHAYRRRLERIAGAHERAFSGQLSEADRRAIQKHAGQDFLPARRRRGPSDDEHR